MNKFKNKMNEIQKKLFDDSTDERESEVLNIEYEKLVTELESTDEYKKEQLAAIQQWKTENTPLNRAALEDVLAELASYNPNKKVGIFKKKPELKLLELTKDQILKKHANDFKSLTSQNLTLTEARALYECLPEFRKDQDVQLSFLSQIKEKIENEMKKPKKLPPPIIAVNPPKFKAPNLSSTSSGGDGDFLAELLRKRKVVGC